ncbi:MAG: NAD(P)/FAD-dependent oxidoreductase [Solirubrobacterales bacterium]
MSDRGPADSARVVIAGGGIAGVEALLGLRQLAGDRVELTLVSPQPEFTYKPMLVDEPFDLGPAERHELAALTGEMGARFVLQALGSVSPAEHRVELGDGSTLDYDQLVVCLGGRFRPAFDLGTTFPGPEPLRIDDVIERAAAEFDGRVAFVVPPGVGWPLPIYELALMTDRRARDQGTEIECAVITPEESPLAIFGHEPSSAVARLLEARKIEVRTGAYAHESNGGLVLTPGDRKLEASAIVALPVLDGPAVPGLPADEGGFIPINDHARVRDTEDVYAAGDGTNFPIKQGGLATQQADAAAEEIAARAGADVDPKPFHPVLRGKLIAGDETLSLEQDVSGGGGEGTASADYLWWPPHKVAGRYIALLLEGERSGERDPLAPAHPIDVEVQLPKHWHDDPTALDPYSPS